MRISSFVTEDFLLTTRHHYERVNLPCPSPCSSSKVLRREHAAWWEHRFTTTRQFNGTNNDVEVMWADKCWYWWITNISCIDCNSWPSHLFINRKILIPTLMPEATMAFTVPDVWRDLGKRKRALLGNQNNATISMEMMALYTSPYPMMQIHTSPCPIGQS